MSEANPNPPSGGAPTVARIGSYRLIEQLGSGGMSNVYRAVHTETGHEVAVKILPRSLARHAIMLQRFLREAKSVESLQDPHIVPIFDRGVEDGRYYIVLEYLPGGDLFERVREYGPLPVHEAVAIVRTVAVGLMHAAEQGLIHRDIKPANLLLTSDGKVKITDLGLAMQLIEDDERVTRDGTTVGTVDYMSPEQARDSRATTIRSDIYSLGCTLYFLLTAEPPFPGGDVPEKLRRHAFDPPPDVREKRPDVPEELSELIQRMMAKKPERRFVDYEHLIESIDELPIAPPGEVKEAILDEEEPTSPILAPRPPSRAGSSQVWFDDILNPSPPTAEWPRLADDRPLADLLNESSNSAAPPTHADAYGLAEDSGGFALGPAGSQPATSPGSTQSAPILPPINGGQAIPAPPRVRVDSASALPTEPPRDVNFAALASLEETGQTLARPKPVAPVEPGIAPQVAVGDEAVDEPAEPAALEPIPIVPASVVAEILEPEQQPDEFPGISLTRLLQAGLIVLALVFVGIGLNHGLSWWNDWTRKNEQIQARKAEENENKVAESTEVPLLVPPVNAAAKGATQPRAVAPWVEPDAAEPAKAIAPKFDADLLASLDLTSAAAPSNEAAPSPVTTVRRGAAADGKQQLSSLRNALDLLSGSVEVADDGPFYEQDLRINGSTRMVRAAEGGRVMIAYEKPTLQSARARPAVFVIDGKNVTLEGVDLVVRAADLTPQQTAIFLCRRGSLALRNCTVTIEGPIERPLAVVQLGSIDPAGSGGRATVRLERTLVRAPGASLIQIADGDALAEVVECIGVSGAAPAFRFAGAAAETRRLSLLASLITTSGPFLELAGSAAAATARPSQIRVLGSTLVHLEGASAAGLVTQREPAGNKPPERPAIDWLGDQNTFVGWDADSTAQQTPQTPVDLKDLQALNPQTDKQSSASSSPWPHVPSAWSTPAEIATSDGPTAALAQRVAQPTPNLRAWAVGTFAPLEAKLDLPSADAGTLKLSFDADADGGSGDLGKFLARNVKPGVSRVQVSVRGGGRKWMTPIRMTDGVSLEIEVTQTPADAPLFWLPAEGTTSDALIRVKGGDLVLRNVRFERDAKPAMHHIIEVRQGRLLMENCRASAPFQVEPGGGNLILFETEGTRPIEGGASTGPVWCRMSGCLLMTGGVALRASAGAGVVELDHCAIASGEAAIALDSQKVAPERFAADLRLNRCTIAAERDTVRVGPMPTVPDRPWLISSNACVLIDGYDREGAPSTTVLLTADPQTLTRRGVLWQGQGDVLGVSRFVATTDTEARPSSFPDIKREWVDFWGANHVQNVRPAKGLFALARGKIAPGKLKPEDFVLTPEVTGKPLEVGADPAHLGLK